MSYSAQLYYRFLREYWHRLSHLYAPPPGIARFVDIISVNKTRTAYLETGELINFALVRSTSHVCFSTALY